MCPSTQSRLSRVPPKEGPRAWRGHQPSNFPHPRPPHHPNANLSRPRPSHPADSPANAIPEPASRNTDFTSAARPPSRWQTAATSPTRGASTTPSAASTALWSSSTRFASSPPIPRGPSPAGWAPRPVRRAEPFSVQVNIPQFDEIVALTLPDGTEKQGQVLETRGSFPVLTPLSFVLMLTSVRRRPSRRPGITAAIRPPRAVLTAFPGLRGHHRH